MNEVIIATVQSAIDCRINAGEMFTAWDITCELREQMRLPHGLLKQVVHGLFLDGWMGGEYVRTLCHVGGDRGPAWVYHRRRDNPEHFVTDDLLQRLLA